MKPIIAVDIDDVLAANAAGFVAYSNERWRTNLAVEDYQEHWGELWQVDNDEVGRRAIEIHEVGIMADYDHYQEALSVLTGLQQQYRLVCATSRRRVVQQLTLDWIERSFPGVFDEVYFAGIYDDAITEARFSMTKADLLTEIGAAYHIDDQLKHCEGAVNAGAQAILFGDYPWNRTSELPQGVTRCNDWPAVAAYFENRRGA